MPDKSPRLLIGWTTVSSREDAARLAGGIVEKRLAACAQIDGPITSHYHWDGKLCADTEYRLTIKFPADNLGDVGKWIHDHHPYDTPQWVVVAAEHVSDAYLTWVKETTRLFGTSQGESASNVM
ncbi:MAG: divalent-cation tolerance protein CutA [Puniceicoccales bacterium]|jgi:periplasmic divalent cation tolerance protein|nr:divalent-cation tolerance protein CutA [Puniceicoccales bacterium]